MAFCKKPRRLRHKVLLRYSVCVLLLLASWPSVGIDPPVLTLVSGDRVSGFYHSPEQEGLIDELLGAALMRVGYELRVITVPIERSLKLSGAGIADGELLRTTAIEKYSPNLLKVPEVLIASEFVVFSREAIDLSAGWQALSGASVGIVIGMKIIEENIPKNALVTKVKDESQLFTLLIKKRVDYVVFVRDLGTFYLFKNNIKGLVVNEIPLVKVPAYVYLHAKHAALVPRLARALQEMKRDGSFDVLVEDHSRSISLDRAGGVLDIK